MIGPPLHYGFEPRYDFAYQSDYTHRSLVGRTDFPLMLIIPSHTYLVKIQGEDKGKKVACYSPFG
jgi:hypothetical protein